MDKRIIREGDVHEVAFVGGHNFMIRYGYYTEEDRKTSDPIPIYPCFIQNPKFTPEGQPLITRIQDACEHYAAEESGEQWCADCIHGKSWNGEIGICHCQHRRQEPLPDQGGHTL